jgi:hypothetical protein
MSGGPFDIPAKSDLVGTLNPLFTLKTHIPLSQIRRLRPEEGA